MNRTKSNSITRLVAAVASFLDALVEPFAARRVARLERQLRIASEARPPEAEEWEPNIKYVSPWEAVDDAREISYLIGVDADGGWWFATQSAEVGGEFSPMWYGPYPTMEQAVELAEDWKEHQHSAPFADWAPTH